MHRVVAVLLALLLLGGCGAADTAKDPAGPGDGAGGLRVYTSFYPLYDFAGKIGGDRIELVNLVPAGAEPHDWEPSTSDMLRLEEADLFLYNGAGLEPWVDSLLGALQNRELRAVELSRGLTVDIEDHEDEDGHDEDAEDDHGHDGHSHTGTDPHVWLSPPLARTQMELIKDLLCELDPEGAELYEANWQHWSVELDRLDADYRRSLEGLPHREIVVAHAAFGYLCREYGLEQIAVQGFSPDAEPDPASMAAVVELARKMEVSVIFFEELASPKVAEAIAREIGADTAVLNPIEGLSAEQEAAGADYFLLMEQNLDALVAALSQRK